MAAEVKITDFILNRVFQHLLLKQIGLQQVATLAVVGEVHIQILELQHITAQYMRMINVKYATKKEMTGLLKI